MDVGESWYSSDHHGRWVCSRHVEDEYLAELLDAAADDDEPCSFCGERAGAPLDELLEAVEGGLLLHYDTASNAGVYWEGGWTTPTLDTWDVVSDLVYEAGLDDELAGMVTEAFEDEAWVRKGDPFLPPGRMLTAGWRRFVEHVKHHSRFLLAPADGSYEEALDSGWAPGQMLDQLSKVVDELCIRQWPAGQIVHRARSFEGEGFDHVRLLASPPRELSRQGRMNPAGISMFYGAMDAQTAAAEVYDGRRYAAVAAFESLRPLTVVDLCDLPSVSLFNERDAERVHLVGFLRSFANDISAPIARDDRVHVEYTPTQIFTEHLRYRVPVPEAPVDGVVFPSSRREEGRNVVLFVGHEGCLAGDQREAGSSNEEPQVLRLVGDGFDLYEYAAPQSELRRTVRFAPEE